MERVISIGRGMDNDFVITHSSVSRHHLQIVFRSENRADVIDLNSTNGTYINGRRINRTTELHKFDILVAGYADPIPWMTMNDNVGEKVDLEMSSGLGENQLFDKSEMDTEIGAKVSAMRKILIALVVLAVIICLYYGTK
jgi:hypothetical protein